MKMKGQLVFEFIISAVIFVGIIVFVLNLLNSNVSLFTEEYFSHSLENKVVSVSEAILKTNGSVGLAKKWPVLSDQGIIDFENDCQNDQSAMLAKLGLTDKPSFGVFNLSVEVKEMASGSVVLRCPPAGQIPTGIPVATVKRFALSETGGNLQVTVWIW